MGVVRRRGRTVRGGRARGRLLREYLEDGPRRVGRELRVFEIVAGRLGLDLDLGLDLYSVFILEWC